MVTWAITALAAINTGLVPMELNIFQTKFVTGMSPQVFSIIHYVIGISGVISFAMFVMVLSSGKCGCGKKMK